MNDLAIIIIVKAVGLRGCCYLYGARKRSIVDVGEGPHIIRERVFREPEYYKATRKRCKRSYESKATPHISLEGVAFFN